MPVPGPPPPPPPPPPSSAPKAPIPPSNKALLASIEKGTKLKKVPEGQRNDRSAPQMAGQSASSNVAPRSANQSQSRNSRLSSSGDFQSDLMSSLASKTAAGGVGSIKMTPPAIGNCPPIRPSLNSTSTVRPLAGHGGPRMTNRAPPPPNQFNNNSGGVLSVAQKAPPPPPMSTKPASERTSIVGSVQKSRAPMPPPAAAKPSLVDVRRISTPNGPTSVGVVSRTTSNPPPPVSTNALRTTMSPNRFVRHTAPAPTPNGIQSISARPMQQPVFRPPSVSQRVAPEIPKQNGPSQAPPPSLGQRRSYDSSISTTEGLRLNANQKAPPPPPPGQRLITQASIDGPPVPMRVPSQQQPLSSSGYSRNSITSGNYKLDRPAPPPPPPGSRSVSMVAPVGRTIQSSFDRRFRFLDESLFPRPNVISVAASDDGYL